VEAVQGRNEIEIGSEFHTLVAEFGTDL